MAVINSPGSFHLGHPNETAALKVLCTTWWTGGKSRLVGPAVYEVSRCLPHICCWDICNGAIWDSTKEEQQHKKNGNARYILRTRIYLNIYIDNVPSPLASTLNTINTLKTWQHKRSQTDASRSRCSTAICNLWWRTSQQVAILAIGNLHKRVCDLSGVASWATKNVFNIVLRVNGRKQIKMNKLSTKDQQSMFFFRQKKRLN